MVAEQVKNYFLNLSCNKIEQSLVIMCMYVLMAEGVVLFWIVGVASGMVLVIFFLGLEDTYIFQPTRYFFARIRIRFVRIVSQVAVSSKKVFRPILVSDPHRTVRIPR